MLDRAHQIWFPRDDLGKPIQIWTPTVQFNMAKDVEISGEYLYGRWDGTVTKFARYTLTSKCHMMLGAYPLDVQNCALGMNLLEGGRLVWGPKTEWFLDEHKPPVVVRSSGINAQFQLVKVHAFSYVNSHTERGKNCVYAVSTCDFRALEEECLLHDCISADRLGTAKCEMCNYYGNCTSGGAEITCDADEVDQATGLGIFTSGQIRFALVRRFNFHLIQTYGPTLTTVAMSWMSFWVNPEVVPARVSLNVVTVLTMLTQTRKVESFPEVSYVRAIDVWLFACQWFVFVSLIEYGVVHYYIRSDSKVTDKSNHVSDVSQTEGRGCCKTLTQKEKALRHDYAARVWFPVCFVLFMIGYFGYYVIDYVKYTTGAI
ncbi:glycine receptor subunit alpha-2-like [Branchiostoma lanceolatum]|uniref:glycine receptor subunit alpha-2-like n=1 Tax=Branchiostoma lanceolatum TaxID=7740 RepID=UPI003451CDDE